MKDLKDVSALECLQNAQINFENLARMAPVVGNHPIYKLAKEQLDNGIEKLEGEENVGG